MKEEARKIIVTGGAGFIGSAVIRYLINEIGCFVLNLDKLTYAGNLNSLKKETINPKYTFKKIDICDTQSLTSIICEYRPNIIMHLAAESHVDRSIDGPSEFIQTNIIGTYNLLEASRSYWSKLHNKYREEFRFHHISTDEVFGSLGMQGAFTENTRYDPRSPYSASKASADHLVRAWHKTFGLPVVLSNCSNNYGPYHFPEKLIPLMIIKALKGEPMPVYGSGNNVRDWLYVDDHARALYTIASRGRAGESYNVGGNSEVSNIQVVERICAILNELSPRKNGKRYEEQITFVSDRPGHDFRYAIDATKIKSELDWVPLETFETGLRKTVEWYLDNQKWWQPLLNKHYQGQRLGKSAD